MKHGRVALLLLSVLSTLLPDPAIAQDAASKQAVNMSGNIMFNNSHAPGMILAVVRGDEVYLYGYGETARGNGKEPDGRSIFRLASISKVFTAQLYADMAAEGKVGLMDRLDS